MSDSTASTVPRAVFLSYAREDSAAARRIADALRELGVEVWFDLNELRGGDAWDQKIRKQIKDCALFVPIVSANTQDRGEGYFRLEWKLAVERTHQMAEGIPFLAPVALDRSHEADALVPPEFMRVHWTRLTDGTPTQEFVGQIKRLLDAPRKSTAMRQAESAGPQFSAPPAVPPRAEIPAAPLLASVAPAAQPKSARWFTVALAAVTVALIAYLVLQPATKDIPASAPARPVAEAKTISAPVSVASAVPLAPDKSIAVLPFVNMGSDKADEYLGDGMSEELLNALAKIKGLRVPGRSSSFAFKGRTDDDIFRQVGEKLHVRTVLEGSVRKVGDKIRITVQLINCTDGNHLWSEEYDRTMADLLTVQSEVAQQVAQKLQITLGLEESRALSRAATENPEAHRLYLLGRFHFAKTTEAGYAEATKCYNQALQLDPNYALAYCGLADNYGFFGGVLISGKEAWAKEKELAEKALALDPNLAEAHFSLGLALADRFDWEGGDREMRRAIELNPNFALARDQHAWVLLVHGRFDEMIAEEKKAVELDPLSALFNTDFAWWLSYNRRWDEALAQARRAQQLDPNTARGTVARCLYFKGDVAGAIAETQKQIESDPLPGNYGALAFLYGRAGERAKAEQILRDLDVMAKQRYVSPGARVFAYLGLGEKEKALDWLEKCYDEQDLTVAMVKVEPTFDPLRNEPRFQALAKKVGLER